MKINRWIYLPLIFILAYVLPHLLFNDSISANYLLYNAIWGAIVGFGILLWSNAKARRISGRNDEEVYKARQKRNLTLLVNYDKAFEICKEAVNSLNRAKIKSEDLEKGIIKVKTGITWDSFGQIITLSLTKINENLTEVEISTRPIPRTALVDYGEGWKYSEEISKYLKEKDAEINKKVLVDSAEILEDVYVKPFQTNFRTKQKDSVKPFKIKCDENKNLD